MQFWFIAQTSDYTDSVQGVCNMRALILCGNLIDIVVCVCKLYDYLDQLSVHKSLFVFTLQCQIHIFSIPLLVCFQFTTEIIYPCLWFGVQVTITGVQCKSNLYPLPFHCPLIYTYSCDLCTLLFCCQALFQRIKPSPYNTTLLSNGALLVYGALYL